MLFELLNANRVAILQRVKERAAVSRAASPEAHAELGAGVAAFVSQLSDLLFMRHADPTMSSFERRAEMAKAAAEHGAVLLRHGFTLAQVVHDYMEIGRTLIDIATERHVALSHEDFLTINLSVDAAVAGAVTEHAALAAALEHELTTVRAALHAALHGDWERGAAGNHAQTQSR